MDIENQFIKEKDEIKRTVMEQIKALKPPPDANP